MPLKGSLNFLSSSSEIVNHIKPSFSSLYEKIPWVFSGKKVFSSCDLVTCSHVYCVCFTIISQMVVFRDVLPLGYQALEDFPAPKTLYLLPLPSALGAHLTRGYHGTLFQTPGPAAVLTKVLLWEHFLGTRPDGPQLLSSVSLAFIFHYSIQALPPAPPRGSDFKTPPSPSTRRILNVSSSSSAPQPRLSSGHRDGGLPHLS